MRVAPLFLQSCGIATPLGIGANEVAPALFKGSTNGLIERDDFIRDRSIRVGVVKEELGALPASLSDLDCRNNRLMQVCLDQIAPEVAKAVQRYGCDRIAVVLGTSTSGIASSEDALKIYRLTGSWPVDYHYRQHEIGNLAVFAARWFGLSGPAYTIATACSSSAKVFASARRLIHAGIVDAVVVGGADTLCRMTLNGFDALELLSKTRCNPFSANRDGITIGEGASAFLLSAEEAPVQLLGVSETSDAYHTTAPDPEGPGAQAAMRQALVQAQLAPGDLDYINLHGTASSLNDAMESRAVAAVFGDKTPCSSTKGMTGHMLGAAGGCEAGFLWLTLNPSTNPGWLPPHVWDGLPDPTLPSLNFTSVGKKLPTQKRLAMLSNSFGFGGSNVSLILGRGFA